MITKKEQTAFNLFQFGYVDSIIAARSELPIARIKELRTIYEVFRSKN